MLGILWNLFKRIFDHTYFYCRTCKHHSFTSIGMVIHLYRKHRIKPTKKDIKYLIIYSLFTRGIIGLFSLALFIPLFLIKLVCALFHFIYEIL